MTSTHTNATGVALQPNAVGDSKLKAMISQGWEPCGTMIQRGGALGAVHHLGRVLWMPETQAELVSDLEERVAEQYRTICALMAGSPDDTTTPVIARIGRLEAEVERLRGLLEEARDDVSGELDSMRQRYGTSYKQQRIANQAELLARIDAALSTPADTSEIDRLVADAGRLDYLDERNAQKNKRNGTQYGWRLSENHNRIALEDNHYPAVSVREAIDAARAEVKS